MDSKPPTASSAPAFVLDPATFKKIQPLEYHRRFLAEGVRADGRPLAAFRAASLNVGCISSADSSAIAKLGNTTVICAVKAELAQPRPTSPREGFLVPNIDLPALCSPQFRPGPPGELTQSLSTIIDEIVSSSHIVDLESLCVEPGRLVWVLHVDMVCLDHSGNVLDAAIAAMMAALQDLRLPVVIADEEGQPMATDKPAQPIQLNRMLLSSTFCIFDKHILLADPTEEEEELGTATVTVVMDSAGQLCGVFKPGGAGAGKALIDQCIGFARDRIPQSMALLKSGAKSKSRSGSGASKVRKSEETSR